MDPFSIALAAFANEVGKQAGVAAFQALIGNSNQSEQSLLAEFSRYLEQFAIQIRFDIRNSFREQRKYDAELDFKQTIRLVNLYKSSKKSSADILDELTVSASNCSEALIDIGPAAYANFTLATTMEIAIWQERSRKIHRNASKTISEYIIPRARVAAEQMQVELRNHLESRYSPVLSRMTFDQKTQEPTAIEFSYNFDGRRVYGYRAFADQDISEQRKISENVGLHRAAHIENEWKKILRELHEANAAVDSWQE